MQVVAWGKAESTLGLGLEQSQRNHVPPSPIPFFNGVRIVGIDCGGKHCVTVTSRGEVYCWGWNGVGQLGNGMDEDCWNPTLVKHMALLKAIRGEKTVGCAAGGDHCLLVTDAGRVYAFGSNSDGQLGLMQSAQQQELLPRIVLSLRKRVISAISCGGGHSLALSNQGAVFAWGRGANGRLGTGNEDNVSTPVLIPDLHGTQISCGWSHSLVLDSSGKLYSFGKGSDGQLGLGGRNDQWFPQCIQFFIANNLKVTEFAAGYYHTAFCSNTNVYTCGWGEHGQLGQGNTITLDVPHLVEALSDVAVTHVSCGGSHTLVSTSAGECLFFGDNQSGQSGMFSDGNVSNGDVSDELHDKKKPGAQQMNHLLPVVVEGLKQHHVGQVVAGWWHSLVLTSPQRDADFSNTVNDEQTSASTSDSDARLTSEDDSDMNQLAEALSHSTGGSSAPERSSSGNLLSRLGDFVTSLVGGDDVATKKASKEAKLAAQQEAAEAVWRNELLPQDAWKEVHKRGKLYPLVAMGVPPGVRGEVWKHFIGNRLGITPQVYEHARKATQEDPAKLAARLRLIEVDLPRTFPDLKLFQQLGPFYHDLGEILQAFAVYHPSLGYVQGMSYLGGLILMHMDKYSAFQCLCNMLSHHFFESLFSLNISECLKHIQVYELLFSKHLPELYAHFVRLGISPEQFLLDWLFSLFSRAIPFHALVRVWDCFCLEGEVFLFRTALGILKLMQKNLLREKEIEGCLPLLKRLPDDLDQDQLFKAIESITVPDFIHQFIRRILKNDKAKKKEARTEDDAV